MIDIDLTGRCADVTELPHDEIRANHQIANDLALYSEADVHRGGAGQVTRIHEPCLSASMLVTEKSRLFGSPRACANSARMAGRICSAVAPVNMVGLKKSSNVPGGTPWNIGERIADAPAEVGAASDSAWAQRNPLLIRDADGGPEIGINAHAATDHRFSVIPEVPGEANRWREVCPVLAVGESPAVPRTGAR